MAGLVDGTINGYLDIRGAILRVGQLDVVGISGVDMATNVIKQDSVLIWDDQGTDLNNPPFTLRGGATRDTTNGYHVLTGNAGGRLTRGIKLPNAWMMDFDLYASTQGGSVKIHTYTTSESTYDGSTGYELEFVPSAGTVTLKYRGTQVHQATSVTAYATNTFQHYVIGFERGAWTVSIDGTVVFLKDDDERADVYDNTAGQYFRIDASASSAYPIRMRKFRLASNGFWLKERNGNLSYETGNVSVGGRNATHRFDVRGTANVGALTSTTVATSASVEATDTATGTVTTHSIGVVSNAHVQNVYASNCIVDASLNVFSTANVGALTATSVDASDATAATSVSTGAIVVSGTDGGLGVASNIHATNVFAASHLGIATSDTDYNLDVRGTANVGVLSATLPLATVASNLVTYDTATGQLLDSNGLVSNKLAVVSEQPPSALTYSTDTTQIDGHGKYIIDTSRQEFTASSGNSTDAFNSSISGFWYSADDYTSGGVANTTGTFSSLTDSDGTTHHGAWVSIKLPYPTIIRYVKMNQRNHSSGPASFPSSVKVLGSNDDGATKVLIKTISVPSSSTYNDVAMIVDAPKKYSTYYFSVPTLQGNYSALQVSNIRLYTESFSVDEGIVELRGMESGPMELPAQPLTDYCTYIEGYGSFKVSNPATGLFGAAYGAINLFDHDTSTSSRFISMNHYSSGTYNSAYYKEHTTTVGGTRYDGFWAQIEFPQAFTLSHSNIHPTDSYHTRAPHGGAILGSNDGENWYTLTEFTLSWSSTEWKRIDVNATTPYSHYRMAVTDIATSGTSGFMEFTQWRLFASSPVTKMDNVHISGEISSETLQTGYIKWPRKPLKANVFEGYVVSASNVYSSTYDAYYAFDDTATIDVNGTAHSWITINGTFDTTDGTVVSSSAATFDGLDCHWIQLQSPQAFAVSHFDFDRREGESYSTIIPQETPREGYLYASNDGVDWTRINSFSDLPKLGPQDWHRIDVKNSTPYTHYRLVVTKIHPGNSVGYLAISNLRFFEAATGVGATPTSAKLQVHGSLGMAKGSSLFAGDSVVMETPKHDRPLTRYPELPLTAAASNAYYKGYKVTRSNQDNSYHAWDAFDHLGGGAVGWYSGTNTGAGLYNGTNGAYNGTTRLASETELGEWIGLEIPSPVKLIKVRIYAQNYSGVANTVDGFFIYAKTESGDTWTDLGEFTGIAAQQGSDGVTVFVNSTDRRYKFFALVVTKRNLAHANSGVSIRGLDFFGTEEGDESVDVVHRSVPNKPGTQQLEVYWDANDSASYSFADSDAVYDLSGNGVTGTLTNNTTYDSTYNAWKWNTTGPSGITASLAVSGGDWVHSFSYWMKVHSLPSSGTVDYLFGFATAAAYSSIAHYIRSTGTLVVGSWTLDYPVENFTIPIDEWFHVVVTYAGGGFSPNTTTKTYINGKLMNMGANISSGTDGTALTVPTSAQVIYFGYGYGGAATQPDATAGPFRMYSGKALSADQVKELYDYEAARFGHREDLVSVHKGNLGIGLRDPEQKLVVTGSLQEFPPGPMTSEYTEFTGHGIFRVQGDTFYTPTNPDLEPWMAFNDVTNLNFGRWRQESDQFTAGGGPVDSRVYATGLPNASWLVLHLPYRVNLKRYSICPQTGQSPGNIQIWGSNDGTSWAHLHSQTQTDGDNSTYQHYTMSHEGHYSTIAYLVLTLSLSNQTEISIRDMKYFGVPQMNVTDGRQLNVGQVNTSQVGIGTSNSRFPLQVNTITATGTSGTALISSGTRLQTKNDDWDDAETTGVWNYGSIYGKGDIITGGVFCAHSGTVSASDRRIKKNITDVNDSSALETFRLLQPKLYQYEDTYTRGSAAVWGFIAQEVADTLKLSTSKRVDYVPNVNGAANVHADGAVLEFDTTKLEAGASRLRLYDQSNNEQDVDIDEIIDEFTVRLKRSIGNADQVFVYGQEVNDFRFLKKDAIWTTAAAALQQVDRELQAEKTKVKALESKLAGERVPLENAEGLAVDANYAPCVKPNDPLFLGIVDSDGRVAAKGKRAKVWVTNIGAPLSAGDIIATTSNVAGYCSKLTDLTEVHRAVGKVLVDVALPQVTDHNFAAPTVPRRRKVTETSDVTVWVREFKSTADRYATLPEDERRVRDEVYYARDDVVEVVHNEYVDKMPAYDIECYHRTQIDTCDAEIYEALPDSEKVNYVLGEDGVYTYTHVNMITIDAWNALEDDDERASFVHGYFKNVTEEMSEDEWEALEDSAVQARFEKRTRPVYFRLIVARESRHGYTEEVHAETVDVLDAFGRPTFENVEGETDPAFEFRYLTAEGEISDRHSGVYMAALVECLLF
ncbi:MAG: hypothetical protein CL407_10915 [Acidimicrobiaceae bacterium]|nr:hypothetical protein [Acidimicrobiaceae bacterium]